MHTTAHYNDGSWHQAVGTEGPAGLQLYIDGALAASASTPTSSGQTYTGSWRVGYDSLGGWSSNPKSNYFAGSLAEASFYGTQLSAARVAVHYTAATSVALIITSTASATSTTPGSVVSYTITAANTGAAPYTGATFTESLSGVLDDAVYNGDATATAGSVSYTSPNLTWTGNLAAGAAATVTFTATVNNPDTGDKILGTTVTSAAAGSNCPAGSTDARCATSVPVLIPGLTLTVTANIASATPGSTVAYTVVADNTGQTADTGVSFTAALSGVLDDAAYNGNAAATAGTVVFTSPNLTWTGTLAAGATATITFSVTVASPDTGDHRLAVTLTSTATGNNCPTGSTDPSCALTVPVAQLAITNTANVASTTPGSVVRFTGTFTNTGQVAYTNITISINAADVFDDAVPDGDQTATSGTLTITGNALTWTGSIPVGGTVTITGTVTVNNPDTGNHVLASTITTAAAGSNCPTAAPAAACSVSVPVLTPGLTVTNTPSTTTPQPGSVISYTLTITDTGQTPYTAISVAESFAQMTDDAAYNNDAAATAGTLSYTSPVLTWTGSLAPGRQRGGHVHRHGAQPRHRRQAGDHHRHLGRARVGLPARHHRRALPQHRGRAHPGTEYRGHRRRLHRGGRRHRALHRHHHQHRTDPLHRHHRHRLAVRAAR